MNIDNTIEDFRLGKLDIDCKRIVLSQNKDGGERYEGKGYIRQNAKGVLIYKLYVTKHDKVTPHSNLGKHFGNFGKIHSDDTFFSLEAESMDGTKLTASHFSPHPVWDMSTGEPEFVTGQLRALALHPSLPQDVYCLELHYFEEYELPLTEWSEVEKSDGKHHVVDSAQFDAMDSHFKVKVRDGSGQSVVEVSAEKPFPPDFHWRIQESLQFITGKTAMYRALVTCEPGLQTLELISPIRVSLHPNFCPPIKHASIEYRKHGWELFSAFLKYLVGGDSVTQWSPLAYHFYNAREASANSIDAWAMGVSVALEAISSLVTLPEDQEKHAKTEQAIKLLKQHVANETALKDIKDRVIGLLGMLEQPPGPRDKLKWLATQGMSEKAYIQSWIDLRNALVHPKLADLKKPDAESIQVQLDRIHSVQVLLYQVTYYLIGYSGPYTDYVDVNWPEKIFPSTVAA
jgi:hypothetical protein